MFVKFLASFEHDRHSRKEDNEKHVNAAFLFYIWHGLRFLAKAFANQEGQSTPALYLLLISAPAILKELFPLAGESTPIKS